MDLWVPKKIMIVACLIDYFGMFRDDRYKQRNKHTLVH
jgi:hypothetical protein